MSMTPFDSQLLPAGADLKTYAGNRVFQPIRLWCSRHPIPSALISGPKGTGKTTLVEHFFTRECRRTLAEEKHSLVELCCFTGSQLRSDADVFLTLIEAVTASLGNLNRASDDYILLKDAFDTIRSQPEFADAAKDDRQGRLLLEALTQCLQENGYCISLVIDDFQQLTCSENCARDTFSSMANLAQKNLISYIVITDAPIQIGSNNYVMSSFERIFFDPFLLSGVTNKNAVAALRQAIRDALADWQEGEEDPILFSDEELDGLWLLTAGIPGLLQGSLKALYEYRETDRSPLTPRGLEQIALSGCRSLMQQWTKHLDASYWDTFRAVLDGLDNNAITRRLPKSSDRRGELRVGGLIQPDGSRWKAVCPLFDDFLREELDRPHNAADDLERCIRQAARGGQENLTIHLQVQNVSGDVISQGGTKYEQALHVHAGTVSAEDFLTRLGLFGGGLLSDGSREQKLEHYQQLVGEVHRGAGRTIVVDENAPEDPQRDHELDLLVQETEHRILPDIDSQSLENPRLSSLDQRFYRLRSQHNLEQELNDTLLDTLSPKCRFYVKASLLVEDHMDEIMPLLNDYSTQLVMYGKCLEQTLRDCMYPLLSGHPAFCDYNTYARRDTPGDNRTFGGMHDETKALLGSFYHVMKRRSVQFIDLCTRYNITMPGIVDRPMDRNAWENWWKRFTRELSKAKDLRNRVHAGGEPPCGNDLDQLRMHTFGMRGVLRMSQIGRALCDATGIPVSH